MENALTQGELDVLTKLASENAILAAVVLGAFLLFKSMNSKGKEQAKEQEQKCSGRHTDTSKLCEELKARCDSLEKQLFEVDMKMKYKDLLAEKPADGEPKK